MEIEKKISLRQAKKIKRELLRQKEEELTNMIQDQRHHQTQVKKLENSTGITDASLLDIAVQLGINEANWQALYFVPFVKIAWSDNFIEKKQIKLIKEFTAEMSPNLSEQSRRQIESWLESGINPNLFCLWKQYIDVLKSQLSGEELENMQKDIFSRCKNIAKAQRGFLGIGSISDKVNEALEKIDQAFQLKSNSLDN